MHSEKYSPVLCIVPYMVPKIHENLLNPFHIEGKGPSMCKDWVGGFRKWQFLQIYSTIFMLPYSITYPVRSVKFQKCADVIYGWSLGMNECINWGKVYLASFHRPVLVSWGLFRSFIRHCTGTEMQKCLRNAWKQARK